MIAANALPNRRVEGWRWSDLSAALADRDVPMIPGDRHVLARIAIGARRIFPLALRCLITFFFFAIVCTTQAKSTWREMS